ncbi:MAG: GntR family transcriptional regulator [Pirellulales bacterium]|nr:GntR family transcriptional regulator [Pirellulales bacterium]
MEHLDTLSTATSLPVSLKNKAYEHIRQKLFDGRLREGAHISPVELGREIGISHIPVREAITQLASEGLVVQVARQGAFVRQMQRQELLEMIELRGMLEAATVTKVAKRIKPEELEELACFLKGLEKLLESFRAETEKACSDSTAFEERMIDLMGQWMIADMSFHMLLLRVGGNRQVATVIAERQIMLQMFRHRTDTPEAWKRPLHKFYEENYQVHQDIYQAVRDGNPKAARSAMATHTKRARKNMLARFDWLKAQKNSDTPMARDFPDSMQRLVQGVQTRFMKNGTNL